MKRILFLCATLLSSCAPGMATAGQSSEAIPTATGTATLQPALTFSPTITPTATFEPGSFFFDIASDVPGNDEAEIKTGIDLARAYLRDFLGGDINPSMPQFMVKIVATGNGNDGSCCTGLAESGPRPFFDVKHSSWNIGSSSYWDNTDNHVNAGAHEYVHAWQSSLGCLTIHDQPLGNWLNEGIAQYISINSLKQGGYVTENDYRQLISVALAGTSTDKLASYERGSSGRLDDIALLATIKLVSLAPSGELSLRNVCENISSGKSVDQSFKEAFGISKNDFYKLFTGYQETYVTPTPTPIPAGMIAIHGMVTLANSNQKYSDYILSFCNSKIAECLPGVPISNQGTFLTYLDPGIYRISVNHSKDGEGIGWYAKNGLVPDGTCSDSILVDDKEINFTVDLRPSSCPAPAAADSPALTTPSVMESSTSGVSIIATGLLVASDSTQKFNDLMVTFCGIQSNQCLPGIPVSSDGTFSTLLTVGKYKISINSPGAKNLGWYTKNGLVPDAACADIIAVDVKHETALTINLQGLSCK
ncbi:MAG: hypothetical protein K8S20_01330 [Chloroflexi bacterium]|nr:hypothetical protein [Chloroflexota bacterium]